jgi:hypothetical protein
MLIEAPYKVGDTVSIKLSSGEEMVARLEQEGPEKVTVHKPLMLTATQQGVGLAPYMFTVAQESKFILNANNIICIAKTEKEMANKYIENTTGLAVN